MAFSYTTAVDTVVDKRGRGWQKFLEKGAITSKTRGGRLVFFVNIGPSTVLCGASSEARQRAATSFRNESRLGDCGALSRYLCVRSCVAVTRVCRVQC